MQASDIGRILGIMAAIGIVVFLVVQVAGFARNSGDSSEEVDTTQEAALTENIVLKDFAAPNTSITMTYDGRVISKEEHRKVKVIISQKKRVFQLIRGYDGKVLLQRSYKNTPAAYRNFMKALDFYGTARPQEGLFGEDEEGICPTGKRTIIELKEKQEIKLRLWSASCKKTYGTLSAVTRRVNRIFQDQIPDYKDLVRGIRF